MLIKSRSEVVPAVTVDGVRGREMYPAVVGENRTGHGFCEGGEPIDY